MFYTPLIALFSGAFLLFFLVAFNWFQTFQATRNIVHYDAMTYSSWKSSLFRPKRPAGYEALLVHPDYNAAKKGPRQVK